MTTTEYRLLLRRIRSVVCQAVPSVPGPEPPREGELDQPADQGGRHPPTQAGYH